MGEHGRGGDECLEQVDTRQCFRDLVMEIALKEK